MTSTAEIDVQLCEDPDELFCHYPMQIEAQGAFVAVDLQRGVLYADYNAEIGNGVPADVWHGQTQRFTIPILTADAANRLLKEIKPLADRIFNDWENNWDGSNHVASFGPDAVKAASEIEELCDSERFGMADMVGEDTAGDWFEYEDNAQIAAEHGITATTTDERIAEIAAKITSDATTASDFGWLVLDGVEEYLTEIRDELADSAGCE